MRKVLLVAGLMGSVLTGCGEKSPAAEPLEIKPVSESERSDGLAATDVKVDGPVADDVAVQRCGFDHPVEIGTLTAGTAPRMPFVAPMGLFAEGALEDVDSLAALGTGVIICVEELPESGDVASCGVVQRDEKSTVLYQRARRLTLTWHSDDPSEPPYTSPAAKLFDDCPDTETSDPLQHSDLQNIEATIITPTIPAERMDDALLTSMIGFVSYSGPPLSSSECQVLTLAAERGADAMDALFAAYGPDGLAYPVNVGSSDSRIDAAREATSSFLEANAAAMELFEGNGIQPLHRGLFLNGIVWDGLLENLATDLDQNGSNWMRWKLGRQLRVSFDLYDAPHSIGVMADIVDGRCSGVELTPTGIDAAEMCELVADIYRGRFEGRLALRNGESAYNATAFIYDYWKDFEERYPADSNPFFSNKSVVALYNAEGELGAEIRGLREMYVETTIEALEQQKSLEAFAATCTGIPIEHIEVPTVFEELGTTAEELIQSEEDAKFDYAPFDQPEFLRAIQQIEATEGWTFKTDQTASRLESLLEERENSSLLVGFVSDTLLFDVNFAEVGPAVHAMLTAAGLERVEIACEGPDEFEYVYRSPDPSLASVTAWGLSGMVPAAFVEFELPGQVASELEPLCG